jgi:hypothetical protein
LVTDLMVRVLQNSENIISKFVVRIESSQLETGLNYNIIAIFYSNET